jgi:RND family efflux transporter MFP subunit
MKTYWKYVGFGTVLLLVILWISGFFRHKLESGEVKPEVKKVSGLRFQEVEKKELTEQSYVGIIEPKERAEIATPFSGKILELRVKEGDCVKKGALLVRIEGEEIESTIRALDYQTKEAEAEYRRALAQFQVAQNTFERYSKLLKEKAVTPQEYDEIKGQYEAAKEALERARASIEAVKSQKRAVSSRIKYLNITAPFNGCVTEKRVDLGDLSLPGKPLLVLEKLPYLLKVELPEKFFSNIKEGDTFKVLLADTQKIISGKVVEKNNSIDPATRTFRVKLLLGEGEGIKSGTLAYLLIPERVSALFVPEKAILKRYDFTGVYVLKPNKTLELRWVKLGKTIEGKVEVLSGVNEGEKVVVEGIEKACDGCQVE